MSVPIETRLPVPAPSPEAMGPEVEAALEALLFVVDEPIDALTLAGLLAAPPEAVTAALGRLQAAYAAPGRGVELREVAGGWRIYTREEHADVVERYVLDGQSARLTQAALETLAVVAYLQPVTRSRVAQTRGVSVDGVLRTLVARGLVAVEGEDEAGAHRYVTTPRFLESVGLNALDELPPLGPLLPGPEQVGDLDDLR